MFLERKSFTAPIHSVGSALVQSQQQITSRPPAQPNPQVAEPPPGQVMASAPHELMVTHTVEKSRQLQNHSRDRCMKVSALEVSSSYGLLTARNTTEC